MISSPWPTVEDYFGLDVGVYQQPGDSGSAVVSVTWSGIRDGEIQLRKMLVCGPRTVSVIGTPNQHIALDWTPCNFGGERPWFLCPARHCRRRVRKLYTDGGNRWRCRHCLQLRYASQRDDRASRGMHRSQDIRVKLGGTANLSLPFPHRPKGMHHRTYERLRDEDARHFGRYLSGMALLLERMGARLRRPQGI